MRRYVKKGINMDCFNHNCPFRTNETSNVNRCDCYSCKVRDSESVYVNSNKIITNDTVFVDDGCDKWEMIDINTFKKW